MNLADVEVATDRSIEAAGRFDPAFRAQLRELLIWRRDVRCFRRDALPDGMLERLIALACLAPSVGLSQPWRFVMVDDPTRRRAVRDQFVACNARGLGRLRRCAEAALRRAQAGRARRCPGAARGVRGPHDHARPRVGATDHARDGRILDDRRHPYAVAGGPRREYRARLGLDPRARADAGDPRRVRCVRLVAYLCIGYPEREDRVPALERAGWEQRRDAASFILRR